MRSAAVNIGWFLLLLTGFAAVTTGRDARVREIVRAEQAAEAALGYLCPALREARFRAGQKPGDEPPMCEGR